MNYLARLKTLEKRPHSVLPKLPKPPFDSKDSTGSGHFSENQPTLSKIAGNLEDKFSSARTAKDLAEFDANLAAVSKPLCFLLLQKATERLNAQSCWPEDFRQRMPPDVRRQVKEIEQQLDDSVADGDVQATVKNLTEWEKVLLGQLKRQQH